GLFRFHRQPLTAFSSSGINLALALASGNGTVQPDAALCPPPPNIAATAWTSTPGLARIETRVDFSSTSLSSADTSTPSIMRP
ncbi:MAG TPA: hypothetical protein VIO12_14320, partial [Thermoanaerobaculia bacterium]